MKKTRFTEEQMVTILREADTKPVPDVAKKHGVSGQTIYIWRKYFGSLEPSDVNSRACVSRIPNSLAESRIEATLRGA